jgi:hypothetical protein
MIKVRLSYYSNALFNWVFDEFGDIVSLHIDGVDRSEDGNAIDEALLACAEAGFDIQQDISVHVDKERSKLDELTIAKRAAELDMERKVGA